MLFCQRVIIIYVFAIYLAYCVELEIGSCLLQYMEPCSDKFIKFFILTSDYPDSIAIQIGAKKPKIPEWINFESPTKTKIIIHGYGGNLDFYGTKAIRNAYLQENNTNVIVVDWGELAMIPCYPTAAFNTKHAGECIASFLNKIQYKFGTIENFSKIHLIGFSLGAHVASFASNALRTLTGILVDRITGLDPALPFFSNVDHKWKLDHSDASFVDIIHTNAGIFGKIEASGHVDFYVNGGQMQPACIDNNNAPLCSHMLAPIYFAESISSHSIGFWGVPCWNYVQYFIGYCRGGSRNSLTSLSSINRIQMGEYCSYESRGVVFIDTNIKPPYALG